MSLSWLVDGASEGWGLPEFYFRRVLDRCLLGICISFDDVTLFEQVSEPDIEEVVQVFLRFRINLHAIL